VGAPPHSESKRGADKEPQAELGEETVTTEHLTRELMDVAVDCGLDEDALRRLLDALHDH
jgi:hypothetical protein